MTRCSEEQREEKSEALALKESFVLAIKNAPRGKHSVNYVAAKRHLNCHWWTTSERHLKNKKRFCRALLWGFWEELVVFAQLSMFPVVRVLEVLLPLLWKKILEEFNGYCCWGPYKAQSLLIVQLSWRVRV